MPKLSNVTIEMISLVKKGANNQRIQLCKSDEKDSIICYECSRIRKDGEMSPEMSREIDEIIASNSGCASALTSMALRNVQLTPDLPIEPQFRKAVYEAMQTRPDLYEGYIKTEYRDELKKMRR